MSRAVTEPIVRFESGIGPLLQDDPRARDPVGLFTVDQVADHVERAEGLGTFVYTGPRIGKAVEQHFQRSRSAREHFYGTVEIEIHKITKGG